MEGFIEFFLVFPDKSGKLRLGDWCSLCLDIASFLEYRKPEKHILET